MPEWVSEKEKIDTQGDACHRPLQNGFPERKVYHNFVIILHNFVHQVPNFVLPSFLRYEQLKFGGLVTCSPLKCSFKIKNWIIILYSICTILYTQSQILFTIPSSAIRSDSHSLTLSNYLLSFSTHTKDTTYTFCNIV